MRWQGRESIFPELLNKYYLGGVASGVQPKVLLHNVKASVNQRNFIVKSFDEEYPLLTVNEYVCMSAARAAGLNPPQFYLSDDLQTFVIERFDYQKTDDGEVSKLAVEDFTVLMAKDKYRCSYEHLMKAVNLYTKQKAELQKAFRYIVFNCLIGNGDAHLKNFAVQYSCTRDAAKLTPPYDITHTLIYPTIDNNMALKLAGACSFPPKSELVRLGKAYGIHNAREVIDEVAQAIRDEIERSDEIALLSGLKASILKSLSSVSAINLFKAPYRHDKKRKYDAEK